MKLALSALLLFTISGMAGLHGQEPNRFAAYERCKFADDLALLEDTTLPAGVEGRTVKTIMGPKQVPLAAGRTLVFGYPQTEPFAIVKVEQIPASSYPEGRQDLIANFEQILTGDDTNTRNYVLKPRLNGFEIYGLDRKKLEGGVLGIYLFFSERTHLAATVYFLNQDAAARSFRNLEEYAGLRDSFLNTYTNCAAGVARSRVAPAREAAGPPVAPLPPVVVDAAPALPDAPTPHALAATSALPETAANATGAATPVQHEAAAIAPATAMPRHPTAKTPAKKRAKPAERASAKRPVRKSTKETAKKAAHRPARKRP